MLRVQTITDSNVAASESRTSFDDHKSAASFALSISHFLVNASFCSTKRVSDSLDVLKCTFSEDRTTALRDLSTDTLPIECRLDLSLDNNYDAFGFVVGDVNKLFTLRGVSL
ncbi:unnamed protein product [Trichobilharzia regenti]|nr:unnamed protein product [Trichobilharzia regenti]